MKVKNLNNSSIKTKKLIRKFFAEMLSERKDINKITVTELARRAGISRATFYSHYDDVYSVAEDYENGLIERFFTSERLLEMSDYQKFADDFFEYITENQEEYAMICHSTNIANTAGRISNLAKSKLMEICNTDPKVKNRLNLETEISVLVDGMLSQYVKYFRKATNVTLEDLREFNKEWIQDFFTRRM